MTRLISRRLFILISTVILSLVILQSLLKSQLNDSKETKLLLEYLGIDANPLNQPLQSQCPMFINKPNHYIFNCTNINNINLVTKDIGGGISKTIDIGTYEGKKIVIKRISDMKKKVLSSEYRQLLFLKEILIREQLDHPGLIQMFGYCIQSLYHDSYNGHKKYGIAAVYEHGYEIDVNNRSMTIDDRLKYVLQFAELLVYLQYSPLGSLLLGDFAVHHFLMVDGNIKLIDMDYIHNIEPPCKNNTDCHLNVKCFQSLNETCNQYDGCRTGLCVGYNAKCNFDKVNQHFIKHLLNLSYFQNFKHILHMVDNLQYKLNNYLIDATQLASEMKYIIAGRFGLK